MSVCAILPLLLVLAACSRTPPLPVYGTVPEFHLIAHTGEAFNSRSLEGKIWVADFIFTTCTGPCPRMSVQMRRVQESVSHLPDVKLVSFTVDPERDTPPVLAAYARRHHAQAGRWFFLTGQRGSLHTLGRDVFKLHNVDGSLDHSTRFVLIDRQSRIRGYYPTSEGDGVSRLIADIRRLAQHGS